ncbi:MAG: leucyl aminopeptidase, partial [Burkholderiales bacterium]|nr:leucyl aminopeptidase [Burkholderiales bacterium]
QAKAIDVVKLERRPSVTDARKAGAALARLRGENDALILAGSNPRAADIAQGYALRSYDFRDHKTADSPEGGATTLAVTKPEDVAANAAQGAAIAEGVFFTRD